MSQNVPKCPTLQNHFPTSARLSPFRDSTELAEVPFAVSSPRFSTFAVDTIVERMQSETASIVHRRRLRLLKRIHRRYQTVSFTVRIGTEGQGGLVIPFTRIADPDRVLDEVAEEDGRREKLGGRRLEDDELHLPYWAELWDSAYGIGQYLAEQQAAGALQNVHSVLDLGCGMGLAGTTAAALGLNVLFADLEAPALLFAEMNSLGYPGRARTRRLNWRTDRLGERFELILGADILYEKVQWPHLDAFWKHHLADDGLVVLGEPGRQTGDLFEQWVGGQGWTLTRTEERVQTREKPIRLFELRRR